MLLRPKPLARIIILALLAAPTSHAQTADARQSLNLPAPQPSAGFPVTGHVLCADTQHPARFAQVILIAANQDASGGFGPGRQLSARTDLDGNFTLPSVPSGDYYVAGALSGYINTAPLIHNALNDPSATSSSTLAGIPLIHVSAGGAVTSLSLQRGAVLAGTVTWDDGSPAGGVNVTASPATSTNTPAAVTFRGGFNLGPGFGGGSNSAQTDDRGHFRISGIPPGAYLLRANLQAPAPENPQSLDNRVRTLNLAVYAPDKLRRTDATPITLTAGEERPDLAIVLGLAALHSVSGTVSSTAASVRSGSVYLTDQTDSSLNRSGSIAPDGSFVVPYVPAGTYTLRVNASSQLPSFGRRGDSSSTDATRFQPLQESVTVADSDLAGLTLNVTPATASQ